MTHENDEQVDLSNQYKGVIKPKKNSPVIISLIITGEFFFIILKCNQ